MRTAGCEANDGYTVNRHEIDPSGVSYTTPSTGRTARLHSMNEKLGSFAKGLYGTAVHLQTIFRKLLQLTASGIIMRGESQIEDYSIHALQPPQFYN